MLVATQWNEFGVDLIYTDTIDYNDTMQACIQNIPSPSIHRQFEEVTTANADANPGNDTAQTVKNLAAKYTESGGTKKRVGLVCAGLALAIGTSMAVGLL